MGEQLTPEAVERLTALIAYNTDGAPLPWRYRYDGYGDGWVETDDGKPVDGSFPAFVALQGKHVVDQSDIKGVHGDELSFMVDAVNALPALLEALAAERARVEVLTAERDDTRKLLKSVRGWVVTCSENKTAARDLKRIDAVLTQSQEPRDV